MGFEVWIAIVLVASGVSGWIGYAYARKVAPSQSELDALATELDEARRTSETVQSNVHEHFEQSAVLFGKLAADYREFLDHFSDSAQALGLSESRARELIEQGFQPLLTHEDASGEAEEAAVALQASVLATAEEAEAGDEPNMGADTDAATDTDIEPGVGAAAVAEVTVEMPEETAADSDEPEKGAIAADDTDELTADGATTEADRQRA